MSESTKRKQYVSMNITLPAGRVSGQAMQHTNGLTGASLVFYIDEGAVGFSVPRDKEAYETMAALLHRAAAVFDRAVAEFSDPLAEAVTAAGL